MHRYRVAAVATALVAWMGAAPLLAEGEQQVRRRVGRAAAAAQRAPARPPAAQAAPARSRAGAPARRPPTARPPAAPRPTPRVVRRPPSTGGDRAPAAVARSAARVREQGAAGASRTARGAVRRAGRSDRPAPAAPDRAAARVRRTADAVERDLGRRPEADGRRRPDPTVEREHRRGDRPVRRAVPRPPRGSWIDPGGRDHRGGGREFRGGRDRRGYGRRWSRGQRPGYWYGWNYRRGYGYHRLGPGYRHWYAPHTHVHYPGYTHGHVYGTSFFAPGLSFAVGYGLGASTRWYRGYGHYDPYAYGHHGAYAYHPTDLHTGFLRLKVRPRYAQVFIDGYFVGVVNEFDGVFQRLRLEEGTHQVEIVHPDFEPLELDVLIVPGEKVTFEGDLIPLP